MDTCLIILTVIGVVILAVAFVFFVALLCQPKPKAIEGRHVVITGGSSGIGRAVAFEAVRRGAHVTLVARNAQRLAETCEELGKVAPREEAQRINYVSIDLAAATAAQIAESMASFCAVSGPVNVLVNCAGFSIPGRADEIGEADVRRMMDVNYMGSVSMTQAVVAQMKAANDGVVIFTSSLAGLTGVYGLSGYCGSKFAVRGYAEALAAELAPFNIRVSVNCPPDTETPGFAEEQKIKPQETKLISEGAGLFQSDVVAKTLLNDGLKGKFLSSNGIDGWMLTNVAIGMAPSTFFEFLVQVSCLGWLRFIGWFYSQYFAHVIRKSHKNREP